MGASRVGIAPSGKWKSGVEMRLSIRFEGPSLRSPKSKKDSQSTYRRSERTPPRRSRGSSLPFSPGSNVIAKNGLPSSPVKFRRYDGRTMLCPNRNAAAANSTGNERTLAGLEVAGAPPEDVAEDVVGDTSGSSSCTSSHW